MLDEKYCQYDIPVPVNSVDWIHSEHFDRALEQLHMLHTDGEIDYEALLLPRRERTQDGLSESRTDVEVAGYMAYYISRELVDGISDECVRDELLQKLESNTSEERIQEVCSSMDEREDIGCDNQFHSLTNIGFDATVANVPEEHHMLYRETAKLIEEAVKSDEFGIEDLTGEIVERDDQSWLMTYPTEVIIESLDDEDIPETVITRRGRWTTPDMDYWVCSFALLAVANDMVTVDELEPYQEPRNIAEVMQFQGKPWLSKLSDDDILNLSIEARKYGAAGEPPYRALKSIAKIRGYEFKDEGVLTREGRSKAERYFERMN